VTNERPRSSPVFATYNDRARSRRIVLTAAAPVKSPNPSMREYACVGRTLKPPPMSCGFPKSSRM